MRTELIVIESERDYRAARELTRRLMESVEPDDAIRLRAQALLIQDWERTRHPAPPPDAVAAIRFRIEQLGLSSREVAALFGAPSRASEVMNGKRGLSLAMMRRLHDALDIPLEVLVGGSAGAPQRSRREAAESAGLRPARTRKVRTERPR